MTPAPVNIVLPSCDIQTKACRMKYCITTGSQRAKLITHKICQEKPKPNICHIYIYIHIYKVELEALGSKSNTFSVSVMLMLDVNIIEKPKFWTSCQKG